MHGSRVSQSIAHGRQLGDAMVELGGFREQAIAVDPRPAIAGEHGRDLIEGKASRAPEANERELLHDPGVEETAHTVPPDGAGQPLLLVVAQRGAGRPERRATSALSRSIS